jgi:hypothetical protein
LLDPLVDALLEAPCEGRSYHLPFHTLCHLACTDTDPHTDIPAADCTRRIQRPAARCSFDESL